MLMWNYLVILEVDKIPIRYIKNKKKQGYIKFQFQNMDVVFRHLLKVPCSAPKDNYPDY